MPVRPSGNLSPLPVPALQGWGSGGPGFFSPPTQLSCLSYPFRHHRFWFFKFLVFVGITVGAFYIPDGSFSDSRWPWRGGTGATKKDERAGGSFAHRPQTAGWVLASHPGDRTLVLGHMAFGQLGVGGKPP